MITLISALGFPVSLLVYMGYLFVDYFIIHKRR